MIVHKKLWFKINFIDLFIILFTWFVDLELIDLLIFKYFLLWNLIITKRIQKSYAIKLKKQNKKFTKNVLTQRCLSIYRVCLINYFLFLLIR